MSWTEVHFSTFKVLAKSLKETEQYIIDNKLTDLFNIDYDNGEIDWIELKKYSKDAKYDAICGGKYLIEYIVHKRYDDSDYFEEFSKNEDGTYNLSAMFYNGGCGWDEILGDNISKNLND